MTDNSEMSLQSRIVELQQDVKANQLQLSSKTKKLIECENLISSLKDELNRKNKEIDELRIQSKLSNDHRFDEMHLEIEEYKNQIQLQQSERQQLQNENILLKRQCQQIKSQYDSLSFKYTQNENEYNLRLSRLDTMYKQKIETLKRMNESQIKIYQDKLEAVKQEQFLLSNKETEDIKNSLNELRNTHDQIEADLNAQIEDLKDQMNKREKEKEELINEMKQLSDNYRKHAEHQIHELKNKLLRYEEGDVEIVLKIEVDDPILHKPPPKKPAPSLPFPSRKSSNASLLSANSTHSLRNNLSQLSLPMTPIADDKEENNNQQDEQDNDSNIASLTLANIKSNPEFWGMNHSNPNGHHHKSMQPKHHDDDGEDVEDSNDSHDSNDDDNDDQDQDQDQDRDDSKDSKSDDLNDDTLYPQSTMIEAQSTNNPASNNKVAINGYISRRKNRNINNAFRRLSMSHIKESKSANSLLASSPYSSKPKTPTFYIFRKNNFETKDKIDHDHDNNKGYNAIIAQKLNESSSSTTTTTTTSSSSHKYTDSAIGIIKSMWGTKPQTPQPTSRANKRWIPSAKSEYGAFPTTGYRSKREKNRSVGSFNSDLFSDNLSVTSSGYGDRATSSVKLSPQDALSNKSLELQREMYRQANNRLAEDLKNANKKVMVVRQQAHRKYKQLQIQMQTEQRQWKLKEKELSAKIDKQNQTTKSNELMITKLKKEFSALQAEYNMRIQQKPQQRNNNTQIQPVINAQTQALMIKIQSLESNNKQLIGETEKYRRELSGLKQTVISSSDTMRQQQQQILILNTQISELRKLNGFGGSSSEELLQKQIRLLKSQRRMLVKELKELREQNEQLKNIIVTGGS